MNAELWATLGTIVVTVVFLIVPGVAYAYYVLERWIDDSASYDRAIASVGGDRERRGA